MMDLGLPNIGLPEAEQMPFTPLDGADFTALELVGRSPFIGLLVCRTNDNKPPSSGPVVWPTNTIMGFGTNTLPNGEQKDPAYWAAQCFVEGQYQGTRLGGQSEGWFQVKNDAVLGEGEVRRPIFWAYYHADDEADVRLRGRVLFDKEDATGTLVTINSRDVSGGRRMSVSVDFQLATVTTTDPVKIRGVKVEGASDSCFVFPRRILSDTRPTIPEGATCLWWNASAGELKFLARDPAGGYRSAILTAEA